MRFKQILEQDPYSHTTTYHHYDSLTDQTTIQKVQNVEEYLKKTSYLQSGSDNHFKDGIRKEGMGHVATVPNAVIEQWMKEGVHLFGPQSKTKENLKKLQDKLNGDYKLLKTTAHKVNLV